MAAVESNTELHSKFYVHSKTAAEGRACEGGEGRGAARRETRDVWVGEGSVLEVGSAANVYGGVDWVSMAASANASSDLTDPQVRRPPARTAHRTLFSRQSPSPDQSSKAWLCRCRSARTRSSEPYARPEPKGVAVPLPQRLRPGLHKMRARWRPAL